MSAFPNWQKFAVHQRRQATGCIPTGYEIILRSAEIQGIDFNSFQDDFDLDKYLNFQLGDRPRNNFGSVADEVKKKYPLVEFCREEFPQGQGLAKVARIEEFVVKQRPVLVSLALKPFGGKGWHIMLVVDSTQDKFVLLQGVDEMGKAHTEPIWKADMAKVHDRFEGGNDIAYLSKPSNQSP